MTTSRDTESVLQVHLELGRHSSTDAVFGAVIVAGDGPAFRFVAAPAESDHDSFEHAAVGAKFTAWPFKNLEDLTEPDEWTDRAQQRLRDLDSELLSLGWRRRPERGRFWWSLRYDRPAERES